MLRKEGFTGAAATPGTPSVAFADHHPSQLPSQGFDRAAALPNAPPVSQASKKIPSLFCPSKLLVESHLQIPMVPRFLLSTEHYLSATKYSVVMTVCTFSIDGPRRMPGDACSLSERFSRAVPC